MIKGGRLPMMRPASICSVWSRFSNYASRRIISSLVLVNVKGEIKQNDELCSPSVAPKP